MGHPHRGSGRAMEAAIGLEPMIRALQARALPLGYAAALPQELREQRLQERGFTAMRLDRQSLPSDSSSAEGISCHSPATRIMARPSGDNSAAASNSA